MTSHTFNHSDFLQRLDAYVAGGLADDEAELRAFEAHAAGCPSCAAALAAARENDMTMINLFEGVRPDDQFETRLLGKLRAGFDARRAGLASRLGGRVQSVHPLVRRAATGIAAAILLAGVGFVAQQSMSDGGLPNVQALRVSQLFDFGKSEQRVKTESNLRQIGLAVQYANPATQPAGIEFAPRQLQGGPNDAQDTHLLPTDDADGGVGGGEGKPAQRGAVDFESKQLGTVTEAWGYKNSITDRRKPDSPPRGESAQADHFAQAPGRDAAGVTAPGGDSGKDSRFGLAFGSQPGGGPGTGSRGFVGAGGPAAAGGAMFGRPAQDQTGLQGQQNQQQSAGVTAATGITVTNGSAPTTWAAQAPDVSHLYAGYGNGPKNGLQAQVPAGGSTPTAGGRDFYMYDVEAGKPVSGAAEGAKLYFRFDDHAQKGNENKLADTALGETPLNRKLDKAVKEVRDGGGDAGGKGIDASRGDTVSSVTNPQAEPKPGAKEKAELERITLADAITPTDAEKSEVRAKLKEAGGSNAQQQQQTETAGGTTSPPPANSSGGEKVKPVPDAQQPVRKIIRNGDMTFEVDSFDSSLVQIQKIAGEEGGFVASTDSQKLPNGKVKGMITVRCPAERLDTLVLKLRGLGDLKNSRLAANDITKDYIDLQSQKTAAEAMYNRLLDIIKSGKGEVKDLIEAEKQLGVWREKLERLTGEINYYNDLVALSTLNVTLMERDIRTSGLVSETETVSMGVETDDVEKARAEAIKAIEAAKGRIVTSDLQRHDAGQYVAKIEADVAPDQAGGVTDRIKQLGRVGRLDVQRRQVTAEGTPPIPGARVERKDTRLSISVYNLANIEPRVKTTLSMAADDVEQTYKTIIDQIKTSGGRIVKSQLIRPKPDETTGTIEFDVAAEGADVLLAAVRAAGVVMRMDVNQNPDLANTTDAKRGFAVSIASIASVAPREQTTMTVATRAVADAYNKLREAVRTANGRVLATNLNEQNPANLSATVDFEIKRDDWAAIDQVLQGAGSITSRQVSRAADTANTVDTKIRLTVGIIDEVNVQPRETVAVRLAVADVPTQHAQILDAVRQMGARVFDSRVNQAAEPNNVTANLAFDLRGATWTTVNDLLGKSGDVVNRQVTTAGEAENVQKDKLRLTLEIIKADALPPREETSIGLEAAEVDQVINAVRDKANALKGRVVDVRVERTQAGRLNGHIIVDVPLGKSVEMVVAARSQGRVLTRSDRRNEQVPDGTLSRARVTVDVTDAEPIAGNKTLGSSIRAGLGTSVNVLLSSIQLIIFGVCVVLPWVLLVWLIVRWYRRSKAKRGTTPTTPPALA